jgi:tRNA (cmo5U34)-methyltransferase
MAGVLLAERMPDDGQVLVVGAGGGLETRYLATASKTWRFVGVDPSAAMLELARETAGPAAGDRLQLIQGVVADAPAGPFDAATCILVLGLVPDDGAKLDLLREVRRRLKPGAPFVLADQCIDLAAPDRALRLDRYAAYARASGVDPATVAGARAMMDTSTTIVAPARNEALLREAGFEAIELFYLAMAWRGWLGYA